MTVVNEEDYDDASPADQNINLHAQNFKPNDKFIDPRSCNERSDSGFSECSACSSTPSSSCVCNLTLFDKTQSIVEEQSNIPMELEANANQVESTVTADDSHIVNSDHDIRSENSSLEYDDANKGPSDNDNSNVVLSLRVPTRRELMHGECGKPLSEIEKRKLSLKNRTKKTSNLKQETSNERLKNNNKVAMLMEKFNIVDDVPSAVPNYKTKPIVTNGSAKGLNACRTTNINSIDIVTCDVSHSCDATDQYNESQFDSHSLATAKSPTRNSTNSTTTIRLSGRVREATERLSRPKHQTSLDKTTSTSILKQDSTFARSKEFWKR